MLIPPTGKEAKALSLTMETAPNFNSFISHLMGFKEQPLETHKGKSNQCPGQASFKFGTGLSHSHAFHH